MVAKVIHALGLLRETASIRGARLPLPHRDWGARRVWERPFLSCIGDSGSRPAAGCASEHLGEPSFRQRVAGLHAEPVRGHRRVVASVGLKRLIVMLPAGGDGRVRGGLTRGLPRPPRTVPVCSACWAAARIEHRSGRVKPG